jgi:hypothetical protein
MSRMRQTNPPVNPPDNGEHVPNDTGDQNARHLQEAVANPGVAEIPEEEIQTDTPPLLEIPEETEGPGTDESGGPVEQDPALITVSIDRPAPHAWHRLYPDRVWKGVLLAYKPKKTRPPEWYYVAPGLRKPVQKDLRPVKVYLVADVSNGGELFLWILPQSDMSPYYNAVQKIFAKGDQYVLSHVFRFPTADLEKGCHPRQDPVGPDTPVPVLPSRPITSLLPEALKLERQILTTAHPIYQSLTAGGKVS